MDNKKRKEAIGKRIKARRKELNLSQKDLQKKTDIKDSMISNYESGKREPTLANAAKIAHALDLTIDKLYYGDESISFIEDAPNYGIKIVNCFTELMLNRVISKVEQDEFNNKVQITIYKDIWAITRLLDNLSDFQQSFNTYPNPELYLDQIKQSVANEINNNHKPITPEKVVF